MSRLDTCRSEAFRKQCSERMKLRHKLGIAPTFKNRRTVGHSYPETWFIEFLKKEYNFEENVDYETERSFHKFFLDFAWPEKRLCIEIDGDLHRYEKQQINDREKDRLLKEEGWKELRLTWSFIQTNKEKVKELVDEFLKNEGDISQPLWKSRKQLLEEKYKEFEICGVLKDKNGHYCTRKVTDEQWLERKNKILASGVDLTKFGWVGKVSQITGYTNREIYNTIEHFTDLKEKVFRRNK